MKVVVPSAALSAPNRRPPWTAPSPGPRLAATEIAERVVAALHAEADLTPKPGLVDRRGRGAHTDMDLAMLHASAEAIRETLTHCVTAARSEPVGPALRARIGAIGRDGELAMLAVTGGVNTHRGALWALGLLAAGVAADRGSVHAVSVAAALARLPDRGVGTDPARPTSHGSQVRRRYGGNGARGEAQAGFPHVIRRALPTLRAARANGADDTTARLDALLSIMTGLDDTCILHRAGLAGLAMVRDGASAVLVAGGCRTAEGRARLAELDNSCVEMQVSPGGSGDLLAAALFLDSLPEGSG